MSIRPLALLLLACSCVAFAQYRTGVAKPEPAMVTVREFCRQDFLGGRLSADGWNRMKPLTTWKDNPDWRRFRLATRYEQVREAPGYRTDRITVEYFLVGDFELGIGFTPMTGSESIEFRLRESDNIWRIENTDPDFFPPHLSKARAIQWMQARLKTVTDTAERLSLESALKQLQPKP